MLPSFARDLVNMIVADAREHGRIAAIA